MSINKIQLPINDRIKFSNNQQWIRDLSQEEQMEFRSLLGDNLVVVMNDFSVELYLGAEKLCLSYQSIKNVYIYYVKRAKGPGWISLEGTLVKTNESLRILEIGEFSDAGLVWFLSNKLAFERVLGLEIGVRDCGYDC